MKYWSLLFPRVTYKQIDEFFKKYQGSEEELNDVARVYEKCKGDMDVIMETVISSHFKDESRIRDMINQMIKDGKVQAYEAFLNEDPKKVAKRAKRRVREEKLFAREQKRKGQTVLSESNVDSLSSLASAIMVNRQRQSESLIDRLTEKYCKPPKPAKRASIGPKEKTTTPKRARK